MGNLISENQLEEYILMILLILIEDFCEQSI